mmetsp:Transcript_63493/g.182278  ORF Transcript_63493/g.182278 Transcript_63493/m.182278 type:complete len:218 (-) Transcript_63493:232-885(-)
MRDQQAQGRPNGEEFIQRALDLLHCRHRCGEVREARHLEVGHRQETLGDLLLKLSESAGNLSQHPAMSREDGENALLKSRRILGGIFAEVPEVLDIVLDDLANGALGGKSQRQVLQQEHDLGDAHMQHAVQVQDPLLGRELLQAEEILERVLGEGLLAVLGDVPQHVVAEAQGGGSCHLSAGIGGDTQAAATNAERFKGASSTTPSNFWESSPCLQT